MTLGASLLDGTLRGLSRLIQLHPEAWRVRRGLTRIDDIPYLDSGSGAHTLDIYRPKRLAGLVPVVLYVHGGGFRILSKETHWMMAQAFASRGYLVCNINYRLAPRHPFPTPLADVCCAALWVKRNVHRFGGDATRLILAGESAGANLVSALAFCHSFRRPEPWARALFEADIAPRAVLAACGILQVSDPGRFERRKTLPRIVNSRIHLVSNSYLKGVGTPTPLLADPLRLAESDAPTDRELPPFFLPCGTKDPILDDSRRMCAALERRGAVARAPIYPGGLHAFHAMLWDDLARQMWRDQFAFLDELGLGPEARIYQAEQTCL
ncbi:MAG: alpha/beta hydrolase [Myxococcales bacterium]|nr:alpha/beta hydrolase [Myxococcales bacterium]